MSLVFLGVVTR